MIPHFRHRISPPLVVLIFTQNLTKYPPQLALYRGSILETDELPMISLKFRGESRTIRRRLAIPLFRTLIAAMDDVLLASPSRSDYGLEWVRN